MKTSLLFSQPTYFIVLTIKRALLLLIKTKETLLILSLILVSHSTYSAPSNQSVVTYPSQYCHALQRPIKNAIADTDNQAYAGIQDQVRWDIVCVGDVVNISTPIFSNGGDVIIYANKIDFSAPIDTRVYISPNIYSHYIEKSGEYSGASQLKVALKGSKLESIFNDYYQRSPDRIVSKNNNDVVFIPENPSGLTGQIYTGCEAPSDFSLSNMAPSTPPPQITEKSNIKPGMIKVYANSFSFNDKALDSYSLFDGDPLSCSTPPALTKGKVFIARGMRGGRGGAGATTSVFNDTGAISGAVRFKCVDSAYSRPGLLNSVGGPGGDGGYVSFVIVGKEANDLKTQLESRTSIDGGPPGSSMRVRAPAEIGPAAATSNDVCGLKSEGQWPSPSSGLSGKFEIIKETPTNAILDFFSEILSRDARPDYDFNELIERAKIPSEKIKGFTYTSFTERQFYEVLASTEIVWLEQLNRLLVKSKETNSPVLDGIWAPLNLTKLDESAMTNDAVQPLRLLSSFNSILGQGPIKSYLINTGGMFNLRSTSVVSQWNSLASRTEAILSATKLDQIKISLSKIAESTNEILTVAKGSEFHYQLSALQEKLRIAQSEADRARSSHSLERTMSALKDAAQGVVMLIAAYNSGEASLAGGAIIKLKGAFDNLSESKPYPENFDPQIKSLNIAINDTIFQFNNFLAYSAQEKSQILSEQRQNIVDYFETNTSYGVLLQARTVLFHDLLRTILIGYFLDPSKNRSELKTNLVALYTMLKDYPSREPSFSLRDIQLGCSSKKEEKYRCIFIGPIKGAVSLNSRSSDWTNGLPLYVISPIKNQIALSSYGASWSIVPLKNPLATFKLSYKPLGTWTPDKLLKTNPMPLKKDIP